MPDVNQSDQLERPLPGILRRSFEPFLKVIDIAETMLSDGRKKTVGTGDICLERMQRDRLLFRLKINFVRPVDRRTAFVYHNFGGSYDLYHGGHASFRLGAFSNIL